MVKKKGLEGGRFSARRKQEVGALFPFFIVVAVVNVILKTIRPEGPGSRGISRHFHDPSSARRWRPTGWPLT